MSKDKIRVFRIEVVMTIVLTICTLFRFTANKYFAAGLLLVSALVVCLLIKNKRVLKVNKKKIILIMAIFAVFYVAIYSYHVI